MINKLKYTLLPGRLRRKWSYDDFLYYRMQEMDVSSIESFMTIEELATAERQLNNDSIRHIFNSKRTFYDSFREFIIRDVLFGYDYSFQDFQSFLDKHPKTIIKPDDMYAGIGVYLLETDGEYCKITASSTSFDMKISTVLPDYSLARDVYDFCRTNNYMVEECITGYSSYADIAPSSLNTIRVTTYIDDVGKVDILFAVNQFGYGGSIVDNDDNYCIWGLIDLETGIITAVDIDVKTGIIYERHPDTNKEILGYKNPFFEDVKRVALQAASRYPDARLIGWDVAVRSDGRVEIIEGNVTPELDLYQAMSHKGLRHILQY